MAAVLLICLVCLPAVLYGLAKLKEHRSAQAAANRNRVVIERGGGTAATVPTIGMTIGPSGFGTVLDAPERIADAKDRTDPERTTAMIASDVRAFIRALPRPPEAASKTGAPLVCTLEGPPVWRGRLALVDGCLRLQVEGDDAPGPLVLGPFAIFRDSHGYLSAVLGDGSARHEVRVGAPNVRFGGVGCSMDVPVAAPRELAKGCGVAEMRRIGSMERRRRCGRDDLARRDRLRREFAESARRVAAMRAACLARGGTAQTCPPGLAPPPLELSYSDCLSE